MPTYSIKDKSKKIKVGLNHSIRAFFVFYLSFLLFSSCLIFFNPGIIVKTPNTPSGIKISRIPNVKSRNNNPIATMIIYREKIIMTIISILLTHFIFLIRILVLSSSMFFFAIILIISYNIHHCYKNNIFFGITNFLNH